MKKLFQALKLKSWSKNLLFLVFGLLIAGGITVSAALTWTAEWTNVAAGQIISVNMLTTIRDRVTQTYNEMSSIRSNADCGVNQVMTGINTDGTMACVNANSFSDITCDWTGWEDAHPSCHYTALFCSGGKVTQMSHVNDTTSYFCGTSG
jgi:hypothetical protein